jgi:hypothetical protein
MPMLVVDQRLKTAAVFVLFLSAFLWDFRPMGIRALDFIAIFIAGLFVLFNYKYIFNLSKLDYAFSGLISLYSIYGYVNYTHRSSLIIIVYTGLYVFLRQYPKDAGIYRALKWLLILSLTVFFVQFTVYHISGYFIDFQNLFGSSSRPHLGVNEEYTSFFRAVGLYSEPHTYCVSIALLILATLGQKKFEVWHYVASFSLLVSLSMWGILAGVALPAATAVWYSRTLYQAVLRYLVVMCVLGISFIILYGVMVPQKGTLNAMFIRFEKVFVDDSYEERFKEHVPTQKSLEEHVQQQGDFAKTDYVSADGLLEKLIGHGLSTYPFLQGLALNGYAFIIHSVGILGCGLISLLIFGYWRHFSTLRAIEKLSFLGGIALLLTSYPMITYAFFWIFWFMIPLDNKSRIA